MTSKPQVKMIPKVDWTRQLAAHRCQAEFYTLPARKRRGAGISHPVEDFLFQYYPFPLALLEKWHPGVGYCLEWDLPEIGLHFSNRCYSVADGMMFCDPVLMTRKSRESLRWILELLVATQNRPPNFACHGLHEWAMVYRGSQVRHEQVAKLRLPQAEIDALVEARAISCSHYDAFRHFAPEAVSYNHLKPTIETRTRSEQPGCVHANMDLYKWAAKAMPWVGSEILIDCFKLAIQLRDLDMRASPYDLGEWGYSPIQIETNEGRKIYENEQKRLTFNALEIRNILIKQLLKLNLEQSL